MHFTGPLANFQKHFINQCSFSFRLQKYQNCSTEPYWFPCLLLALNCIAETNVLYSFPSCKMLIVLLISEALGSLQLMLPEPRYLR